MNECVGMLLFIVVFGLERGMSILMIFFIPNDFSEEDIMKSLGNYIISNYYKKLSHLIEKSNKLIEVLFGFSFALIIISFYTAFYLFICPWKNFSFIGLIIEHLLIIIIWSISLDLDNKVYIMRENLLLQKIISKNTALSIIIISTIYLLISIIFLFIIIVNNIDVRIDSIFEVIISIFFIFESFYNIFILASLPKGNNYGNEYFQKIFYEYAEKYKYSQSGENISELENLQPLNKAFLSFIIIIFILTFIKLIATIYTKCKYDKYKKSFLIPFYIQFIFITISFSLIIAITSKVYKNNKSEVYYIVTYKLKRKILIVLINVICYIILFVFEFILVYNIKETDPYRSSVIPFSSHPTTSSSVSLNVNISQNIPKGVIPSKLEEIIKKLEEKINDFIKTFIEEENKVKNNLIEFLKERRLKLEEFLKDANKKQEKVKEKEKIKENNNEKFIKDLNKKEYDCEIDILINEVNKIHYIFELGVDTIKLCKDIIIESLNEKMASLPSFAKSKIESQIKEITDSKPIKFLDSTFGKPLKTALEKYGLNATFLDSFKEKLMNERKERRENERKEFSLEENTFGDEENIFVIDLYKFIIEEFNDEDFKAKLKKEILSQIVITNI